MKPLIGIMVNYDYREDVGKISDQGMEGQDWHFIAGDYMYAIEKAGGVPVLLPCYMDQENADKVLDRLDGLMISGGNDVDPQLYGQRIKSHTGAIIPQRDEQEINLIKGAVKRNLPVLGICRGLQIMAVAFGGTLFQDLAEDAGKEAHSLDLMPRNHICHYVTFPEGSVLRDIYKSDSVGVNSLHHQGIDKAPENGTVLALSEDEVIEAMHFAGGHDFTVAVQWHPEMMFDSVEHAKLFKAFVDSCEK